MKLDLITPQQGIPPTAPYEKASGAAWAAPSAELERGGQAVAQVAGSYLESIQRAKALEDHLKLRTEAASIRGRHAVGLSTLDATLKASEKDPDAYMARLQQGATDLLDELSQGVKNPEALALAMPHMVKAQGELMAQAIGHKGVLRKDFTNATIDATVEDHMQAARGIALGDHGKWKEQVTAAQDAVKDGLLVNGANKTGDELRRVTGAMLEDRARSHAKEDPEGFQRDGGKLYGGLLNRSKLDDLDKLARDRIEANIRQADHQRAEAERIFEKNVKRGQDATEVEARKRYDAGKLTYQWLSDMSAPDVGMLKPEKFEHYVNLLKKGPEDVPFDPAIGRSMGPRVYSIDTNPRAVKSEVENLIRAGKLPYKGEGEKWLSHLEMRMQAKSDKGDTILRSDLKDAHSKAEQLGAIKFRTTGALEALTKEGRNVYVAYMEELTRRSAAGGMGGTENPLEVDREITPKYMAQLSDLLVPRLDFLRHNLQGYETVDKLKAARPKLSQAEYYRFMDYLQEYTILTNERASMELQADRKTPKK